MLGIFMLDISTRLIPQASNSNHLPSHKKNIIKKNIETRYLK